MPWRYKLFGPPGTGKTTTMINTLSSWLRQIPIDEIAFVTFTRAARKEVEDRVKQDPRYKHNNNFPRLKTIHAMCYAELRGVNVMGAKELKEFGKSAGVDLNTGLTLDPLMENEFTFTRSRNQWDKILQAYHLARHKMLDLSEVLPIEIPQSAADAFINAFREWKNVQGLSDFTDLLFLYLNFGHPLPIRRMIIDEAQDLSKLQWKVVDKMSQQCEMVYMAGDDDQAIFNWAGASSEVFLDREVDEFKVLGNSHRLTAQVKEVADKIISRVDRRQEKVFIPRMMMGPNVEIAFRLTENMFHDPNTMILARGRSQLNEMLGPLKFLKAKPLDGMMTIHQAKGREANTVVLNTAMPKLSHDHFWQVSDQEEHRVWYVAVTRAKHKLVIYKPDSWRNYDI